MPISWDCTVPAGYGIGGYRVYTYGLPFELFAKRILYISLSCESDVNRCKRSCPLDHASLCMNR